MNCGQILRYAVPIELCKHNVNQSLKGSLKTPKIIHMTTLVEPKDWANKSLEVFME